MSADIEVRPLEAGDLDQADKVYRMAFGTFIGLPDPMAFAGDTDYIRTRFAAPNVEHVGAFIDGEIVGSNFVTRWGSVGFFGPLTVRPDLWDGGIAKRLLAPTVEAFDRWGLRHSGLFTFAASPKHHALYQSFGFWPRFLTPIMSAHVDPGATADGWDTLAPDADPSALAALTDAVYPGLDLTGEIAALQARKLGEVVILGDVDGLAVCHIGPGTEAGSGALYVKFGCVRPRAGDDFEQLLDACTALAARHECRSIVIGVNAARVDAYRRTIARGFRTIIPGVSMTRGSAEGYDRPDSYVIDDWR